MVNSVLLSTVTCFGTHTFWAKFNRYSRWFKLRWGFFRSYNALAWDLPFNGCISILYALLSAAHDTSSSLLHHFHIFKFSLSLIYPMICLLGIMISFRLSDFNSLSFSIWILYKKIILKQTKHMFKEITNRISVFRSD